MALEVHGGDCPSPPATGTGCPGGSGHRSAGSKNPAVHGRVVDLDPAVGEHGLEVTVADWELQVPAHRHLFRPEDMPDFELLVAAARAEWTWRWPTCRQVHDLCRGTRASS